ncbi:MAG: MBL fold metallo-hydrolase [Salinivirgaceae bacterium]|nr:MBL fold metallo-hydrolase [Salinivirgaceae bacterium]
MVQICALASGSNGNCYYVGNGHEAVLIDAGISNRQLKQRLRDAGLSAEKIRAVFITHEHTDHIRGMRSIIEKNNIPGFATRKTYQNVPVNYRSEKVNYISAGDTFQVGSIKIHAFDKQHDAAEPVSFRIEIDGLHVAVLTDLGKACQTVKEQLSMCHAAFLECNYDASLLQTGSYPAYLKKRVSSDFGHLSNHQAFELVRSLTDSPLNTLFLSHISAENNRVELAMDMFKPIEKTHRVEPTSRFGASKVIELSL